jgi:hypothetical protein
MRVVSAALTALELAEAIAAHANKTPLTPNRKSELGVMNCFASGSPVVG